MAKCPDCDGEAVFSNDTGNGNCSACHGTGDELDPLSGFTDALSGSEQKCKTCGGSGNCQTCNESGTV